MSLLSLQQVRFAFPGWPSTVDGVDLDLEQAPSIAWWGAAAAARPRC